METRLPFQKRVVEWLSALVRARHAVAGSMLISPEGDVAVASGTVTPEIECLATTSAQQLATASITDAVSPATVQGGGFSLHLIAIRDGWVLVVQTTVCAELPMGLNFLLRCAREDLNMWLPFAHVPRVGGRGSGQGGASAEVVAEQLRKRTN